MNGPLIEALARVLIEAIVDRWLYENAQSDGVSSVQRAKLVREVFEFALESRATGDKIDVHRLDLAMAKVMQP